MSDQRVPDDHSTDPSIPEDPSDEAQEQLDENDEQLREGDVTTPEDTVPET